MAIVEIKCEKKDYSFLFTPYKTPIAVVKPGDDVFIVSPDALMGNVTSKDHVFSERCAHEKYLNPVIGPVFIEGAEPGDTLVVKIIDIEFLRDFAVSCIGPDFGALVGNPNNNSILNIPYSEHTYIWNLSLDGKFFYEKELDIQVPADPFLGCLGVAPDQEAISSMTSGWYGGNMDAPCTRPGNIVYFPVTCEGALFFSGDCHGRQGQGELCGDALEIPARTHLVFDLIKGRKIKWPRVESADKIMVIGSARPMEEAAKLAYIDLIRWMQQDYNFKEIDAYELLTQVGELYVGNSCDPNYSLVASIAKKYLKRIGRSQ